MADYGLPSILRGILEGAKDRAAKPIVESAVEKAKREAAVLPKEAPPPVEVSTSPLSGEQQAVTPQALEPKITSPETVSSEAIGIQTHTLRQAEERAAGVEIPVEIERLQKLELGKYDLGEDYQPNYDMMSTTDDVKAIIADAAARNAKNIEVSRQGVVSNEELARLGEAMGGEKVALDAVMKWFPGSNLPPPALVLGARQLLVNSADTILSYAKRIGEGLATDQDKIRFRRQLLLHDEFLTAFMGVRAEYGRGLNAFSIRLGPDGKMLNPDLLKEAVTAAGGNVEEIAAKILKDQTTRGISKVVRRTLGQRIGGAIKGAMMGSALSGITTQEVNAFGNALMLGMNIVETALGARVPKLYGVRPSIREGESSAMLFGALTATNAAFKRAWEAAKGGTAVSGRKAETDFPNEFTAKAFFAGGKVPGIKNPKAQKFADGAFDFLGSVAQFWPQRVMVPMDEFFKELSRGAESARLGYLKALDASEQSAITPEEFSDIIRATMDTADEDALDTFAKNMTFQGAIEKDSPFAAKLMDIGRSIRRFPGGFLIAMFIKTPTVVFTEGLGKRGSALMAFNQSVRRDLMAGGRERDLVLARFTLSSLTAALTASYAASGSITGYGPTDPDERALWLQTHQPYSFKYYSPWEQKWKWQSYARAEPWSSIVGAISDAVEIGARLKTLSDQQDPENDSDMAELATATATIIAGVVQNTMKKVFLMGPAQFFQAVTDPGRYLPDWLRSNASLLIPWATFRSQMTKLDDPLIREAWDTLDKLKARSGIVGMSKELRPKRDPFGRVIKWPTGEIQGPLSPFPAMDATEDPVITEILEVGRHTGEIAIGMPGKKIEGMKMTQVEWDEFILASRADPAPSGSDNAGMTFYEATQDLIDSSLYQSSTWDERLTLLREKQRQYDSEVRGGGKDNPGRLERDLPGLSDRLWDWRVRQEEAKNGL